jgi:integrase
MPLRYRMKPRFWFCKPQGLAADELLASTRGILTLRLTVNGKRTDLSTSIHCLYKEWDAKTQRLRGNSDRVKQANAKLTSLVDDANRHYYDLERAKLPVTADRLKQLMQGGGLVADESLADSWKAWGAHQARRLEAGEITDYTASLYELRWPHVEAWLKHINRPSLLTREVTPPLVRDFRLWLLSPAVPSITSAGYANKVARLLSECCSCAVERGVLAFHPCPKLRLPAPKARPLLYLTSEQLLMLTRMVGLSSPLQRTRDGFLLMCYTGLAWADARLVRASHASEVDDKGQRWLRQPRQKTDVLALIPLLPEAKILFDRYAPKPVPICANQLFNARLKMLGERLALDFPLTSHIGRKTFAMLAAERGVSAEAIGAMLGHMNLKHSHIYSKVKEGRVLREMREAGLLPPAA